MTQHTEGPWLYDSETGEISRNDGDVMPLIATVDLDNVESIEQGHADGRLIAEAPSMADALRNLVGFLEANYDHNPVAMDACDEALKILARIDGGS